jgi:hypothetical protein
MRWNWTRERIVLVLQALPNCGQPDASIASGIHVALRGTGNDMPTYPVVDSVSCGGEVAHSPLPTSSPPPRLLSNACTVGRVPDKGEESFIKNKKPARAGS